jgi:hypothetical protein
VSGVLPVAEGLPFVLVGGLPLGCRLGVLVLGDDGWLELGAGWLVLGNGGLALGVLIGGWELGCTFVAGLLGLGNVFVPDGWLAFGGDVLVLLGDGVLSVGEILPFVLVDGSVLGCVLAPGVFEVVGDVLVFGDVLVPVLVGG